LPGCASPTADMSSATRRYDFRLQNMDYEDLLNLSSRLRRFKSTSGNGRLYNRTRRLGFNQMGGTLDENRFSGR
jgi:hypothetical protein